MVCAIWTTLNFVCFFVSPAVSELKLLIPDTDMMITDAFCSQRAPSYPQSKAWIDYDKP